jgi:aminopeptidase-like protein
VTTPQNSGALGREMHEFIAALYPICRSITGDGLRETLRKIADVVPLELVEVPTGTQVFDWTVPKEWNIRDAYVKNSRGERVIDFQRSNLHVVNYSIPVRGTFTLAELRPHLHSLPEHPDWIPYRTSYYQAGWGFCVTQNQLDALAEDNYEVVIDSTLEPGSLTYGELVLPGETADEVLVSVHCCHPSLCNDNLSGIAIAVFLARHLADQPRKHTFRFLFVPGTIGPITWLSLNETIAERVRHGLVLTCAGDAGKSTYKRSRRGNALIDRAAEHVLKHAGSDYAVVDFTPYGYDERQYCSPGFNLPVGGLSRTPGGQFPEYHTSADDLSLVRPEALEDTFEKCARIFEVLDGDCVYLNTNPKCEPQLGRRGLYEGVKSGPALPSSELAMLWVLNLSDGAHSLLDVAERSHMPFRVLKTAADALEACGLLVKRRELATALFADSPAHQTATPVLVPKAKYVAGQKT